MGVHEVISMYPVLSMSFPHAFSGNLGTFLTQLDSRLHGNDKMRQSRCHKQPNFRIAISDLEFAFKFKIHKSQILLRASTSLKMGRM